MLLKFRTGSDENAGWEFVSGVEIAGFNIKSFKTYEELNAFTCFRTCITGKQDAIFCDAGNRKLRSNKEQDTPFTHPNGETAEIVAAIVFVGRSAPDYPNFRDYLLATETYLMTDEGKTIERLF